MVSLQNSWGRIKKHTGLWAGKKKTTEVTFDRRTVSKVLAKRAVMNKQAVLSHENGKHFENLQIPVGLHGLNVNILKLYKSP